VYLSARVQIHPGKIASEKLWEVSWLCKDLWNALLEQRLDPNVRGHVSYYSRKRELPTMKRELPEFKVPCSQVLQEVVQSHDAGWQMFFTKRRKGDTGVRPPKFKSKHYLHKMANRILDDHQDVNKFMIGDWDKRKTLADTGVPFVNRRINRQVQNNNPLGILVGYLKYKAMRRHQEVEKFNERGTTGTCSKCNHVHKEGIDPGQRIFHCKKCSFTIERDINSTLNFLKIYQYAVWRGLSAVASLSIARFLINASSGANRTVLHTTCILNYQDARSL
jgi:transposase